MPEIEEKMDIDETMKQIQLILEEYGIILPHSKRMWELLRKCVIKHGELCKHDLFQDLEEMYYNDRKELCALRKLVKASKKLQDTQILQQLKEENQDLKNEISHLETHLDVWERTGKPFTGENSNMQQQKKKEE